MILQLLADCGGQIQLGAGRPTAQAQVGGLPAQHLEKLIRLQLSLAGGPEPGQGAAQIGEFAV